MKEITEEKLAHYFKITGQALEKVKIAVPEESQLYATAKNFLDMAQRYFDDALHFKEKDNSVNAFAALSYAHGWLDAGARLGVFDVDHDNKLFTVD